MCLNDHSFPASENREAELSLWKGMRTLSRGGNAELSQCLRQLILHIQQDQTQVVTFIPFPHLKQWKEELESRVIQILHGCRFLTQIKQVHAHIYRNGLEQCCYPITKLVRRVSELGLPMDPYARAVFHQVHDPNPFLWTALIRGYALSGQLDESVALYGRMKRVGTSPLSFTSSSLLKSCGREGDESLGRQIHAQVVKSGGFDWDLLVGNALICMYVKCGAFGCGRKVFDEMPERDIVSETTLIAAYAKNGDMAAAKELFDGLPVKDSVVWTAMINGYAQNARPGEALEFFDMMQAEGVQTDDMTLVGVISACGQLGASKYATWVLDIAHKLGIDAYNNVFVGSALVDMFTKCGMLEDAYKIFKQMRQRNVYTYSAMISGFAAHGCANKAIEFFHDMITAGIKPNEVTFMGLLTACSHAGMVEEGKRFFATMEESYGVTPSAGHYTCMVDLLGRAGRLEEALDLAKSMPLKPHAGVWGALLGSCRTHGNPDIAEVAASHLFDLEPNVRGNYVLLSNIYALAGRWDDVAGVRELMMKRSLRKHPACSWIERKRGIVDKFFAGDLTHPLSGEMMHILEHLLGQLKLHGYQPNLASVSYDICEDDGHRILLTHSEKLALSFGLLTTDDGSTIRIMKNLRMCEDCHMFMCGTSKITRREIVVRDNMRFHHFNGGECSCGNFW